MNNEDTAAWEAQLREAASTALYGADSGRQVKNLTLMRKKGTVADSQAVYLVDDHYVLHVAPAAFPETSVEDARKALAMRERLGTDAAGRFVLEVSGQGRIGERTFSITPRCTPLGPGKIRGRIARLMARGEVLRWLRQVAASADPPDQAARDAFLASLAALQSIATLPDDIRRACERPMQQVLAGQLAPRHVPMHGDLWHGNVMRRDDGRLVVIDWGGSNPRGYGIYDLVRCAQSFGLSQRKLAQEVRWHGQALGSITDAPALHLLGALGYYARNLGEFPLPRFVDLATDCYRVLDGL